MSELAPLSPIGRDEAREIFDSLEAIERSLGDLPHKLAAPSIQLLGEVRASIEETFPGGYAGQCINCGLDVGHDEGVIAGDGDPICNSCIEKHSADSTDDAPEAEEGEYEHG